LIRGLIRKRGRVFPDWGEPLLRAYGKKLWGGERVDDQVISFFDVKGARRHFLRERERQTVPRGKGVLEVSQ